jgi:putative membrane protein
MKSVLMSKIDFTQPRLQSSKGLILIFLQQSGKAIKLFWPAIIYLLVMKDIANKLQLFGLFILGAGILTLIHSFLYFRNFKYHVINDQFILNKGYINRKTLTIPLERIQNVKTNQSILQQFLNVMSLEIDTAGTDGKELKILSLTKHVAVQLALELSSNLEIQSGVTSDDKKEAEGEEEILSLSNRDLLKIGISQNHTRAALLILVFGNGIFNQISDLFEEKAKEYSSEILDYFSQSGFLVISLMVVAFLILSFLFSLIRTLILFYNLKFLRSNKTYRIVSGLLNRRNVLVPFYKIQQLNWETGPVKKMFGIFKVNMKQATSGLTPQNQMIEIPGCLTQHIEILTNDLFGEDKLSTQTIIRSSKYYFNRNWLFSGWIPFVLLTPAYFYAWTFLIPAIIWLVLAFFHSLYKLKKSYFQINNDQIRVSSGAISHKFKQMELHKVQHLEFQQSFIQKRRNLANLKIGNASGSVRLPFIDADIARSIHNYLLYNTEISNQAWM